MKRGKDEKQSICKNAITASKTATYFWLCNKMFFRIEWFLPYPPTINHYWMRGRNGQLFISKKGRQFRQAVAEKTIGVKGLPLRGELQVELHLFPPDNRRRDTDNPIKIVLDALEKAGVFKDDCQVKAIYARMWPKADKSEAKVIVRPLQEESS